MENKIIYESVRNEVVLYRVKGTDLFYLQQR